MTIGSRMQKTSGSAPADDRPFAWMIFLLLISSIGISYIDRGALSIAMPALKQELHLSSGQIGWLFSAFFWTYAGMQPVTGMLLDRFGTKRFFGFSFLVWSLATLYTSATHTMPSLMAGRLMLGAGESVTYPAYSRILIAEFSERRRGFINGVLDAASKCGPALSTLIGAFIIRHMGWRSLFFLLGTIGLAWLIPWFRYAPRIDSPKERVKLGNSALIDLLRIPELWTTSLAMFGLGYGWSFLITWLPDYLVSERNLSLSQVGVAGSLPFFALALSAILFGWVSDAIIARGYSPGWVRKLFIVTGFFACGFCIEVAGNVRSIRLCIVALILACITLGLTTSNIWAVTQAMAGSRFAGTWTGIQNAIGNMGGVFSSLCTGWILGRVHSYNRPLEIASMMFCLSGIVYLFGVRTLRANATN